jgi:DMSO/TMAO reductase YedYZ molybdopterin-dependent catalytic subunit
MLEKAFFHFIVALLLSMAVSCTSLKVATDVVEVRDYQGERLDSIDAFRENSIKGPEHIDISSYKLTIDGLVDSPQSMSYEEVLSYPSYKKVVTLYCVEGWDATILWEGVLVNDLIDKAGPEEEANTVIFHASDGYTTSLPLDYIKDNGIILAFRMNDATIIPERGYPFQLVAEDRWGYKWIKWVTRIELSDDIAYKGYWEERGYNNDGSLNGSKFG